MEISNVTKQKTRDNIASKRQPTSTEVQYNTRSLGLDNTKRENSAYSGGYEIL
jgi:hypothetical protein